MVHSNIILTFINFIRNCLFRHLLFFETGFLSSELKVLKWCDCISRRDSWRWT